MKVRITDRAAIDIRQIRRWVERDNPVRAASFVRELRAHIAAIGSRPRAYPVLHGFEKQGIRRSNFGSYLIFYIVDSSAVRVLHVLHGARDYPSLLDQ